MDGNVYRLISATNKETFDRKKEFFLKNGYQEAGDFCINLWQHDRIYHQLFLSPNQKLYATFSSEAEPGHPMARQKMLIAKLDGKIKKGELAAIEDSVLLASLVKDLEFYDTLKKVEQCKVRYKDRLLIDEYKKKLRIQKAKKDKARNDDGNLLDT